MELAYAFLNPESDYSINGGRLDSRGFIEFSQINILSGANNSGKSRFLLNLIGVTKKVNNIIERKGNIYKHKLILDLIGKEVEIFNFNSYIYSGIGSRDEIKEHLGTSGLDDFFNRIQSNGRDIFSKKGKTHRIKQITLNEFTPSLIYIPSNRTLRKFSNGTIKEQVYNYLNIRTKVEVKTGESMYDEIADHLLGTPEQRKRLKEFEEFLAKHFFQHKTVTLIPYNPFLRVPNRPAELEIKIGADDQYPIFNLGDGLQMLIIMLWPLFEYESGVIFIEEPELYLHPGYLRQFMQIISSPQFKDKFQFFITSHSNHILDFQRIYSGISIFGISKTDDNKKAIVPIAYGNTAILDMLGVGATSVFLANCIIWVEGISDLIYIRHYLRLAIEHNANEYIENYHYAFALSGGSSLKHYDFASDENAESEKVFVQAITRKSFVLVDGDGQNKDWKDSNIEVELKDRFHRLKVKEIENLLTIDVIKRIIKRYPSCLNVEFNDIKDEITNLSIGYFIDNKLIKANAGKSFAKNKVNPSSLKPEDKVKFARFAVNEIQTYAELSAPAKVLCDMLIDFISTNNPTKDY